MPIWSRVRVTDNDDCSTSRRFPASQRRCTSLQAADIQMRSRLTMAYKVRGHDFVKGCQLTRVHGLLEPPDQDIVLVAGRKHCQTRPGLLFSACAEVGDVTRGSVADIGAAGRKDFCAVDSSHHLPAARAHAALHEQPVEADTFVT